MLRGIFDNEWFCVKFCPSTLEGSLNKQHNPYFLFLLSYGPTLNWRLNGDKRTFLDDLMGRNGLFLHETYNRAIHIFSNEIFTSFVFYLPLINTKCSLLIGQLQIYSKPLTGEQLHNIFLFVKVHLNLQ